MKEPPPSHATRIFERPGNQPLPDPLGTPSCPQPLLLGAAP
jgi:hypothetical protein